MVPCDLDLVWGNRVPYCRVWTCKWAGSAENLKVALGLSDCPNLKTQSIASRERACHVEFRGMLGAHPGHVKSRGGIWTCGLDCSQKGSLERQPASESTQYVLFCEFIQRCQVSRIKNEEVHAIHRKGCLISSPETLPSTGM